MALEASDAATFSYPGICLADDRVLLTCHGRVPAALALRPLDPRSECRFVRPPPDTHSPELSMAVPWYEEAYCRNVVDMHINDWDERFLSRFDPQAYADRMRTAGAESTVLYAHSHVGLTNYPTRHGQMHRGLKGRNIFAETAAACRDSGVAVQLYYSLIFDTWAYRAHEDWRIRSPDGSGVADTSRYGVCCPNSPYRDHAVRMVDEFCQALPFDGVRFDMTFWPTVCFCPHCRDRFRRETGHGLPTVIDWDDPVWVAFQRHREHWLNDFAELTTAAVQRHRPDASVEHQASTLTQFWRFGVTWALTRHNTFLQGDFYGTILQGSVARKVFHNLSEHQPAGFETSFSVSLNNHTARKSADWMRCKACAAVADGAAFVFIDAVDPEGTINPAVYETMAPIFAETRAYKPFLGGQRCQDVVLYLSTESKYDPADNGMDLAGGSQGRTNQGPSTSMPHVDALFSAAAALIHHHVPLGIITRKNLDDLERFSVIVLPDVLVMDAEEVEAIRRFVAAGGCVYASKNTSLQMQDGTRPGDFMLGDVFGVSWLGDVAQRFTYVAPAAGRIDLFEEYRPAYPLGVADGQTRIAARSEAQVWATTTLPYSDPDDWERFTSIHSDPPGIATGDPAVVCHRYGQGRAIYSTAALEAHAPFHGIFVNLIRLLCPRPSFTAKAPPVVEVTAFWQADHNRHVVSALNFQEQMPNVPVHGARLSLRTDDRQVRAIRILPDGPEVEFSVEGGYASFVSPPLEVLRCFAVEYDGE